MYCRVESSSSNSIPMSEIATKHSSHLLRIYVKRPTSPIGKHGHFRGFEGLIGTDLGRQAIGLL
jgi:hypothetical protein